MKGKISRWILSCYNVCLAVGAIWSGIGMLTGRIGEYPVEWIGKMPFTDWHYIAYAAIGIFGIGNLLAAILVTIKNNKGLIVSACMGGLLLGGMLSSVLLLGEVYLATVEFSIIGVFQLILTYHYDKKRLFN